MTEQGRRTVPPGLPLWRASEQKRVEEGIQKYEWIAQIGIGRKSYDRLTTQENPPITRTVKKIADRIGMPIEEAMQLAGLLDGQAVAAPAGSGADLIVQGPKGRILLQVRHFHRAAAEQQLDALRKAAEEAGRTLGDALVIVGLAEPEELELTKDDAAGKPR
ncbi:hypothetical protein ACBJ59_12360 [Nonomuraea sp. MTCD27]|uniref:hypothetical protein n=1 Tax=Nonomuraea sp. MTCD27 TaxID=1676747 RepID=UPI0035C1AED2